MSENNTSENHHRSTSRPSWCSTYGVGVVTCFIVASFSLGMAAWGFYIYGKNINDMIDSDTCMAQTTLNLILSFCVITIVGALCCILAVILSIFDVCSFNISKNGKDRTSSIRPCFTVSKICVAILGWPMTGLLIAIAVLTYSKKCKTEEPDLYSMIHAFLITQLVTIPLVLVLAMCVSCCAQCCCYQGKNNHNDYKDTTSHDPRNEYLLITDENESKQ